MSRGEFLDGFRIVCSTEKLKEIVSTDRPFLTFTDADFLILPFDIELIEGVELPKPFPPKGSGYENIYSHALEYFKRFPNCCEHHKRLKGKEWFDKNDYKNFPISVVQKIYYADYLLEKTIANKYPEKELINFIEHTITSLGQLPTGYGSKVGFQIYTGGMKLMVEQTQDISEELKSNILNCFEVNHKNTNEIVDLNQQFDYYKKWLDLFPFELEYFQNSKSYFQSLFPIFKGKVEYDKFKKVYYASPHSLKSLADYLKKLTTQLLNKVNSVELVKKGLIANIDKHYINLINETHRVKQFALLNSLSSGENEYLGILKEWLNNERDYFALITPTLKEKLVPQQTQSEKLIESLKQYGFLTLPMVKDLHDDKQTALFDLICTNALPYQIAMFDYLGFLKHLLKEHFTSAYQMHPCLAEWLSAKKNIRNIKGNINVLSVNSKDDRVKFTAHKHKQIVAKDYQNLK